MRSRFEAMRHGLSRQGWASVMALVGFGCLVATACDRAPVPAPSPSDSAAEPTPVAPPPPPDAAFLALLTPEQTAQIRALGVPVVLPTAIPPGFGVAQLQPQSDERFAGYQILYRDGGDRCFLIEFTVGGIGDIPATANRQPLTPPLLTDDMVEYGLNYGPYAEPTLREQFPEPVLVTDWLPVEGGFVRLAGAALINNTLLPSVPCTNVAIEEAIAIVDSLAVITDEIQGDG